MSITNEFPVSHIVVGFAYKPLFTLDEGGVYGLEPHIKKSQLSFGYPDEGDQLVDLARQLVDAIASLAAV